MCEIGFYILHFRRQSSPISSHSRTPALGLLELHPNCSVFTEIPHSQHKFFASLWSAVSYLKAGSCFSTLILHWAYLSSHLLHSNSQTIKDLCLPSVLQYKEQLNCLYRQIRGRIFIAIIFILHCSTTTNTSPHFVMCFKIFYMYFMHTRVNSLPPDNNYVYF